MITMEAIQQPVICPVAKVSVKRKTRKQRLAEEPSCPVCLETLTNETLCKPVKCHNICTDCLPVCNTCPLCRNDWTSNKQARKKCESGECQNKTDGKCVGLRFRHPTRNVIIRYNCNKHVCSKHGHGRCVRCSERHVQIYTLISWIELTREAAQDANQDAIQVA